MRLNLSCGGALRSPRLPPAVARVPRNPFRRPLLVAAAAGALLWTAAVALGPARAAAATTSAIVGGADSSKGAVPALVLTNVTDAQMTLDLTLRDSAGTVLVDRAGEISLGARQTLEVDLLEQFKRDLPRKTKPYQSIFAVEVRGEAPFAADTVLVHVTQYFGSRKRPKAAFVLRPVYRDNE